jgi:hypothetical protein
MATIQKLEDADAWQKVGELCQKIHPLTLINFSDFRFKER